MFSIASMATCTHHSSNDNTLHTLKSIESGGEASLCVTDLASVFHSLLVFLLVAGEDLHLDEATDGHERPEAEQQQRQLPRVDEADSQAARHG